MVVIVYIQYSSETVLSPVTVHRLEDRMVKKFQVVGLQFHIKARPSASI